MRPFNKAESAKHVPLQPFMCFLHLAAAESSEAQILQQPLNHVRDRHLDPPEHERCRSAMGRWRLGERGKGGDQQ